MNTRGNTESTPTQRGGDITDSGLAAMRRAALGGILHVWRGHKGLSVENAAKFMGIGHMTLRRLEAGGTSWAKTYAKLDEVFNLRTGSLDRALSNDEAMVDLARDLGVDTTAVSEGVPARRWLLAFTGREAFDGDVVMTAETEALLRFSEPITVTVADIVARLARDEHQSPAKRDAVAALLRVLPELVA